MEMIGTQLATILMECGAGAAEVSAVIAPVNLKFLHVFLTDRETDTAGIVVELLTVNGNAVAAPIAAVKKATEGSASHGVPHSLARTAGNSTPQEQEGYRSDSRGG